VAQAGKYELILPEAKDTSMHPSFEQSLKAAHEKGVKYLLIGEINKIGNVLTVSLSVNDATDGKLVKQTMEKALTEEDVDLVLQRMATEMVSMFTVKPNDIYSVTKYEGQELNKKGVNYSFGATIGGGIAFANNIERNFPAGFGIMGSYDAQNIIFNMAAELYSSDFSLYHISLDVMKPFTIFANTPYISAGVAYGGISAVTQEHPGIRSDEVNFRNGGLTVLVGAGYIISRTSQVSFRVGCKAFLPLYNMDRSQDVFYSAAPVKSIYTPGLLLTLTITISNKTK
jgi:hypothetical protein